MLHLTQLVIWRVDELANLNSRIHYFPNSPTRLVYDQWQPDRLSLELRGPIGGQAHFHRALRVEDADRGLAILEHAGHDLVHLGLKRVVADVRRFGHRA